MKQLHVNEIFTSIDGEVNRWGQGCISVFIRLAGCQMRCSYCDTERALDIKNSTPMSVAEISQLVIETGIDKVTITGGEPLTQGDSLSDLLWRLSVAGKNISVETNGGFIPSHRDQTLRNVDWVFDYKLPSSGMVHKRITDEDYVSLLSHRCRIKFVIKTDEDYNEAVRMYHFLRTKQFQPMPIAFSPMMGIFGAIEPEQLLFRMVRDKLFDVTFNVQIHRFIFRGGEDFLKMK